MSLKLAFRAFFKALKQPKEIEDFLLEKKEISVEEQSHLRLLNLLQNSSRLIDFFKEDISSYSDAQVGTAVRKIHADCAKALEDLVTIRPVVEDLEGAKITLNKGYDPTKYKIMGNIKGSPPFTGTVRHRGWKAHKLSLPKTQLESSKEVLCPAEVEV
ncbi:MAG: DUF2760 domain-containing protein [Parachlamydiales bacterium]|nr:DUF2760 domain-containing protein [Parachlamydiales bacterium]